jgi:hypothetical protein
VPHAEKKYFWGGAGGGGKEGRDAIDFIFKKSLQPLFFFSLLPIIYHKILYFLSIHELKNSLPYFYFV